MNHRLDRARRRLVKLTRVLRDPRRFAGTAWCLWNSTDFVAWAQALDGCLWEETREVAARVSEDAATAIRSLPITGGQPGMIGGGGCDVSKLYFLARYTKPEVIVETGVSAGYSSRAFLEAIKANGFGRLYSSDLPIHLTREQVGCIVSKSLRADWELHYDGDASNLPRILENVPRIDLLHYDSDKSIRAKTDVLQLVRDKMAPDATIVIDDIDRDLFFRELSGSSGRRSVVFRNVGVIGIGGGVPSERP